MRSVSNDEWGFEEFGHARLSDRRWTRRLAVVAAQAARRPSGKVTEVFGNAAQRQGAYGLLESEDVEPKPIAEAMFVACARRSASEPFVFCPVDGTSLTLVDRRRAKDFGSIGARSQGSRGLKVINAMVLSPDGVPLGLSSQRWWARSDARPKKHRDLRRPEEKEIGHWLDALEDTRQVMATHAPQTRCWFQLDREGDAWPLLLQADQADHWFTIRANRDRRIIFPDGTQTYLRKALALGRPVMKYALKVRPGPGRAARSATMIIRASELTLDLRDKLSKKHFPKTVNAVHVLETGTTPAGEKPIEWLLLTNHPIGTTDDLKHVILGYSTRWRIEEFHRTWKSGACRVEETQLRSMAAVIKWATILAAVAVRIERLKKLAREQPKRPATDEFSPVEIRAIALLRFGKAAKTKVPDGATPTIEEVTHWVAQIGGYTGKSSGGPPGSITLARGLRDVEAAVQALEALQSDL